MDFFSPSLTDVTDTTSLFILQLACIVNMVPRWKKLNIRVFVAAQDSSSHQSSETTGTDLEGHEIHSMNR